MVWTTEISSHIVLGARSPTSRCQRLVSAESCEGSLCSTFLSVASGWSSLCSCDIHPGSPYTVCSLCTSLHPSFSRTLGTHHNDLTLWVKLISSAIAVIPNMSHSDFLWLDIQHMTLGWGKQNSACNTAPLEPSERTLVVASTVAILGMRRT